MKKPSFVLIFLLLSFLAWVLFHRVHEYAVDKETVNLACRTYYFLDKNLRFDFHTVLYTEQDCNKPFHNYVRFTVYIDHPTKHSTENEKYYTATMHFVYPIAEKRSTEIIKKSIRLSYTTEAGEILPPADPVNICDCVYEFTFTKKFSKQPEFSEKIIEHIYFELLVDGKIVKVKKDYPLSRVPHWNLWDALMGV